MSSPPPKRKRRRQRTAPVTKSTTRLSKEALRSIGEQHSEERPTDRSQCIDGPRPCPWVGCRHHLYLDVNPDNGSIKFNFPDIEPDELFPSCSLDITEDDGATLDEIGAYMNLSRERIRQVEVKILDKLKGSVKRLIGKDPKKD